MTDRSIQDFVSTFNLHDRGIDRLDRTSDGLRVTFDLFHCDDPQRDDERMAYLLTATFADHAVDLAERGLPETFVHVDGEILDTAFADGVLRLGISWWDYQTQETAWCVLLLSGTARNVKETVKPLA